MSDRGSIDREVVERVARLARLALSEAEKDLFTRQLGEVLHYVDRLNEVPTDGVAPTSHAVDLENVTRPDVPEPPLAIADVLDNAPETRDGMFIVPPVIEGGTM